MLATNTTENIFRFLQLRPAVDTLPDPDASAFRLPLTSFARTLATATDRDRRQLAREALEASGGAAEIVRSAAARRLLEIVSAAINRGDSVDDLRSAIAELTRANPSELPPIREATSDLLIAAKFANVASPYPSRELDRLFRASNLLRSSSLTRYPKFTDLFRRPLVLPDEFRPRVTPVRRTAAARDVPSRGPGPVRLAPRAALAHAARINQALEELTALIRPGLLNLPSVPGSGPPAPPNAPVPFSLTDQGVARLSPQSRAVLSELELRPEGQAIDSVLSALEAEIAVRARTAARGVTAFGPQGDDSDEPRPYLRDVGVADLLVVKQHLKKYERMDIAHIENVLQGEKKSRTHRAFERTEETLTTERETIQERQTELETAERFEMNREAARTVSRDQQFGFGLTLSGRYGPAVEFSSTLQGEITTTTEDTVRSATNYSKDVVERSLERVVERIREEHVRVVIREQEETNLHEVDNDTPGHISGVYQFIEKVLESQVFNYGIRQMFDFMIPEPASYLWYLEQSETEPNVPTPPPTLESEVSSAAEIHAGNYLRLAAQFGADAIESPPPIVLAASVSLAHGQDASGDTEEGQPRSLSEKDVSVPDGYRPYRALVRPLALTDDTLTLAIVLGHTPFVWRPTGSELTEVGDDHRIGSAQINLDVLIDSHAFESQGKLGVQVAAFETNTYSLTVEVLFLRTLEHYTAWQVRTYDKLAAANRERLQRYAQQLEELRARAEAEAARESVTRFGSAPSQNVKTVKGELKKHCISIVTRQRYDDFDSVQDADPPYFDFIEAAEDGTYIRFFEQAFEWDQMQYVFYPYFWSRKSTWAERFLRREVDFGFQEFLQAGAARVVVPVRPGFEVPLAHYLETGNIWNGDGELPPINSPLYVPIITEIQERNDAPQDEIPVGEPWPTHVPTPLVILRRETTLPEWQRVSPDGWEWEEEEVETDRT